MRPRNGDLTPQEKTFVKHAAATGSLAYAGYRAGYADPDKSAYRVVARPEVANAIRAEQVKRLEKDALALAVDFIISTLQDDKAAPKIRLEAAKVTLSYTLGRNAEAAEKAPEDMTAEEIAARLAELRAKQERFLQAIPEAEVVEDQPDDNGDIFG